MDNSSDQVPTVYPPPDVLPPRIRMALGDRLALYGLIVTVLVIAGGALIKFGALEEQLAEHGRKLDTLTAEVANVDGRLDRAKTQIGDRFQKAREREAALSLALERLLTLEEVRAGGSYQPPPPPAHTSVRTTRRSRRASSSPRMSRPAALSKVRTEARQALQAKASPVGYSDDPLAGLSF